MNLDRDTVRAARSRESQWPAVWRGGCDGNNERFAGGNIDVADGVNNRRGKNGQRQQKRDQNATGNNMVIDTEKHIYSRKI
jgi:hypothetical protein